MKIEKILEIREAAKKRIKDLNLGDPVTNVCAGDKNPARHMKFVEYKVKSYTNSYGIVHKEYLARCKSKSGKFHNVDIEAIYPGHLDYDKCTKLWKPVWEAKFK